ncbi:MAG: hypothetical protein ACO3RB_01535 [Ilumatobacteraceae bacterium]
MRRVAVLFVPLVLVSAGCGPSDPQVITIAPSIARNEGAADSVAGFPSWDAPNVEFVLADGLAKPASKARAWRVSVAKDAITRLRRLAEAFAIDGDPVTGDDGSVTIGNGRRISSWSWAGVVSWSYDALATGGDVAVSAPCDPSSGLCDSTVVSPPDRMERPENLLSADDALVKARRILGSAGYDAGLTALEPGSSEWSTWVDVELLVGGLRSGLVGRIDFGEDGAVTSAYGQIVETERADEYPLVDLETAVQRLSDPLFSAAAATRDIASTSAGSGTADQVMQVSVSSVELVLQPVTESDASTLLVPSYQLSSQDGVVGTAFALEETHMTIAGAAEPAPGDEPVPGTAVSEPAPDDLTPVPQEQADSLVGLAEDEAAKVAESRGWVVRIAERDGEQFMLTMDYVPSRVNLTIAGGRVTGASVG